MNVPVVGDARSVLIGLLELVENASHPAWLEQIAPACDARDYRRFTQLVVLSERHDRQAGVRAMPDAGTTAFLPAGPRVILTAWVSFLTPARTACRASLSNTIFFAAIV